MIKCSQMMLVALALLAVSNCSDTLTMTKPDYQFPASAGDPVQWGLFYLSDCENKFPGEIMNNSIVGAFKRSQIKHVEAMLNTYYDGSKAKLTSATQVSSGSAEDCDSIISHAQYDFAHYENQVKYYYDLNDFSPPPKDDRFRILYMGQGDTDNYGSPTQWIVGEANPVDLGGGYIRGLAVVYVDDIYYVRCKENRSKDWIANEIVYAAVHELGHIAVAHASDAHTNHTDPYLKCCYLKSGDLPSDCGYGIEYAGFCKKHTVDIANRRYNVDKY